MKLINQTVELFDVTFFTTNIEFYINWTFVVDMLGVATYLYFK